MSLNKSAMIALENASSKPTKGDRPISPGGRTLSKAGSGKRWEKKKERAVASTALKAADKRRRDAYNANRK